MKRFLSIFFSICIIALITLPAVFANGDLSSPLNDIKSALQGEDIHVVDYSRPTGNWGSIPYDIQKILIAAHYDNLHEVAEELRDLDFNLGQAGFGFLVTQKNDLNELETKKIGEFNTRLSSKDKEYLAYLETLLSAYTIYFDTYSGTLEPETDNVSRTTLIYKQEHEIIIRLQKELTTLLNSMQDSNEDGNVNFLDIDVYGEYYSVKALYKNFEILLNRKNIKDHIKSNLDLNLPQSNTLFNELENYYLQNMHWGGLPDEIILELKTLSEDEPCCTSLWGLMELDESNELNEKLETLQQQDDLNEDEVKMVKNAVNNMKFQGEYQINSILKSIAGVIRNLLAGLAIIWIIIAGVRMVFAQGDESVIKEQKNSIIYGMIGLAVVLVSERIIDIMFGIGIKGTTSTSLIPAPVRELNAEVYGVINFIKAILGSVAIVFLVVDGLKAIFADGKEEQVTKQYRSMLWIGIALLLIVIDDVIVKQLFVLPASQHDQLSQNNVVELINLAGSIANYLMGFVGVIAFGMLVYGFALLVTNYSSEDNVDRAKKIIKNALIGIIVIISAFTIVNTLIMFK